MVGVLTCIALFVPQMAQGPTPGELEAMRKLDFLVGNWEGEGWMTLPGGAKETFKGTEFVQKKLHGKALLVEGRFTDKDGKVVHETLAVITFDESTKKYKIQTHLFNRPGGDFELTVGMNSFAWKIDVQQGPKINYSMNLENGHWIEIGRADIPNGPTVDFLRMDLTKK
jgi:hypothetical protein